MRNDHEQNLMRISRDASSWTSHTVAVVDQSGSMRNTDLEDGATRSDAVWLTLAMDFVARRLESGEVGVLNLFNREQACIVELFLEVHTHNTQYIGEEERYHTFGT